MEKQIGPIDPDWAECVAGGNGKNNNNIMKKYMRITSTKIYLAWGGREWQKQQQYILILIAAAHNTCLQF